jgi:hypothetical protein
MVISHSLVSRHHRITLAFLPDWNSQDCQASFAYRVNAKLCCSNPSTPPDATIYSIVKTDAGSAAEL